MRDIHVFSFLSSALKNKNPLLGVLLLCKEDKNTYLAQRTQWECSNRLNRRCWCRTLHIFIDLSLDAETMKWPSCEKLTLRTDAVWPFSTDDSPWLGENKKANTNTHTNKTQNTLTVNWVYNPIKLTHSESYPNEKATYRGYP